MQSVKIVDEIIYQKSKKGDMESRRRTYAFQID